MSPKGPITTFQHYVCGEEPQGRAFTAWFWGLTGEQRRRWNASVDRKIDEARRDLLIKRETAEAIIAERNGGGPRS